MKFYTTDSTISNPSPDLLGGKGYGLWEMTKAKMPVPPAIIIPPSVCRAYAKDPEKVMGWVDDVFIGKAVAFFTKKMEGHMPLMSVRSGGKISMPGMMDTILNVGLDDDHEFYYRERLGDDCYASCKARLVEMYSDVVMGIPRTHFTDCDGYGAMLKRYWTITKEAFPNHRVQLLRSIEAVFKSWDNPRAIAYRELNGISHKEGTAVILQAMVYGNNGTNSLTGVVFTRNPNTGQDVLFGEYLVNAQGEDIVSGVRTPVSIDEMADTHPEAYAELGDRLHDLEEAYRDMQDVEFTVDNGKLWILQTRAGKRTSMAAIRIALDLHFASKISEKTLYKRVKLADYLAVTRPRLAPGAGPADGSGIPASGGIAVGRAVFTSAAAVKCSDPCILIANETTPEDITGMAAAAGILTVTGGATSHAAVVARGMNTPAVVGAMALELQGGMAAGLEGVHKIDVGDWVTLDGDTGRFWLGQRLDVIAGEACGSAGVLKEMIRDTALHSSNVYKTVTDVGEVDEHRCLIPASLFTPEEVIAMMKVMKTGVVDLRSVEALDDNSNNIYEIFGGCAAAESTLVAKVAAAQLPDAEEITVILPHGSSLPEEVLAEGKLKVLPLVDNLPDLIMASGPVFMSGFTEAVSGDVIAKVNELKASSGDTAEAVTLSAYDKGSFSKTDMQLLQEVLA